MAEAPEGDKPCRLQAVGLVSALGGDAAASFLRLVAGDTSGLTVREDLVAGRPILVGAVRGPLPPVPERLARYACRNNALGLAALNPILPEVRRVVEAAGPRRVAAVLGTSTSGVSDAESAIAHRERSGALAREFDYAQLEFGGLAGFVADLLGLEGPAFTLSTACSSGARALATARSLLRLGVCDAVVAGAVDTLCGLTAGGFSALQLISDQLTNPCSANRSGLTLGEAAALFLVTGEPGGVQLLGVGESSEAHHMSAPDPEGRGVETAMRAALRDARAAAEDVVYLNLHGTGTPQNDAMECQAVARVMGSVPCSSTKPLVGHTLGAAGALEAAFCALLLERSGDGALELPPHTWDGARDAALPELHFVAKGERSALRPRPLVATNSFGFGGNNVTLVLGRDFGA